MKIVIGVGRMKGEVATIPLNGCFSNLKFSGLNACVAFGLKNRFFSLFFARRLWYGYSLIKDAYNGEYMGCRTGEEEKTRFRSERFFTSDDKVFFTTREGADIGPFACRADAEKALRLYIECIRAPGGNEKQARELAMQGQWSSTHYR